MFKKKTKGFSLLAISSLIMVMALSTVAAILTTSTQNEYAQNTSTQKKLRVIQSKMEQYVFEMKTLPCPANPSDLPNTANYAKSVDCTASSVAGLSYLGTPGALDEIIIGTVPTRDLNLPDEYGLDAWGNKITYQMFKRMSVVYDFSTFYAQSITGLSFMNINDEAGQTEIVPNSTVIDIRSFTPYVLISHGKDGKGAYKIDGSQYPCSGTESENCDSDRDFINYVTGDFIAWGDYEALRLILNKVNPSNLITKSSFTSDASMFDMQYTSSRIAPSSGDAGRVYDWTSYFNEALTYGGSEFGRFSDQTKTLSNPLVSPFFTTGNTMSLLEQNSDITSGIPRHQPGQTVLLPAGTYLIKAMGMGCRNYNGSTSWPYIHSKTAIVAERVYNDEDYSLNIGLGYDSSNGTSSSGSASESNYLISSVSSDTAVITIYKPTKISYRFFTSTPSSLGGTRPWGVGGYPGCISHIASTQMASGWYASGGITPYFATANMLIIQLY